MLKSQINQFWVRLRWLKPNAVVKFLFLLVPWDIVLAHTHFEEVVSTSDVERDREQAAQNWSKIEENLKTAYFFETSYFKKFLS